jgi:hypothetical protein
VKQPFSRNSRWIFIEKSDDRLLCKRGLGKMLPRFQIFLGQLIRPATIIVIEHIILQCEMPLIEGRWADIADKG